MTHSVHRVRRSVLHGVLALTALLHCRAQETAPPDIIARIDSTYTISFADVQKYVYDSHLVYKYHKNKARAYTRAVDEEIVNQLKLIDFFAAHLNENAQLLRSIGPEINEELVIRYYETRFFARYVNEDSMRSAYAGMGKEVVYRQIVLAKPEHAAPGDLASLRARADSIREDLSSGTDVAEAARKYGLDGGSSAPGDSMTPLTWRLSLLSDRNRAIYHLAARAVRVLESRESIAIVKVVEVRNVDVPPYALAKDDIRKALEQRYTDVSLQQFERAKKDLVDERTLAWNPAALGQLTRWSRIPHFYDSAYADTLRDAIARRRNAVVLTHSRGRVDLAEYLRLLTEVLAWGKVDPVTEESVKKYILEAVRTDMLARRARALHLEKEIVQPGTKNAVVRNAIVRLYDRREIDDRIPRATGKALREFYREHGDSLFYVPAKVNIYAVIDSSREIVEDAKRRLDEQVPFEKLAPEIAVKTYVRGRDGTFDTYLEDEPPYLAQAAFALKLHETAGPIAYADSARGTRYALIKCMAIRDEKQPSYGEVKNTIADAYTKYWRAVIGEATVRRLKKKYAVAVYPEVLNRQLTAMGLLPR